MTDPRQHDVVITEGGVLHLSQEEQAADNPVLHHLSVYKTRARVMDDSRVERKAKELHAANSYAEWDGLSDRDKELWRHMARLDLL